MQNLLIEIPLSLGRATKALLTVLFKSEIFEKKLCTEFLAPSGNLS